MAALLERAAIEHLLSRYPFLVDRQRFEELSMLFTADGVMEGPVGEPGIGRKGIEEFFRHSATKPIIGRVPKLMRHHVTSQRVDLVDDNRAVADSYFIAVTDVGSDHWGRYRDAIAKLDGVWLISRRTLSVDGFTEGSWWEQNVSGGSR
jgi:hypothetical protein